MEKEKEVEKERASREDKGQEKRRQPEEEGEEPEIHTEEEEEEKRASPKSSKCWRGEDGPKSEKEKEIGEHTTMGTHSRKSNGTTLLRNSAIATTSTAPICFQIGRAHV